MELKGGTIRETGIFQKGFNKNDVMMVLDSLNARIYELETELENQKDYSEKLKKELENLKLLKKG